MVGLLATALACIRRGRTVSCPPPFHCSLTASPPLLQEVARWHLLLLASHPIWSLYGATPPVLWDCAHLPKGRWDPSRQLWRQHQAQPGQLQYNPSAFFFNMIMWRRDTVSRVRCLDLHAYSNSWTGGQAAGPVGCWAGAFHARPEGSACGRQFALQCRHRNALHTVLHVGQHVPAEHSPALVCRSSAALTGAGRTLTRIEAGGGRHSGLHCHHPPGARRQL